jgi:hypothetical protein
MGALLIHAKFLDDEVLAVLLSLPFEGILNIYLRNLVFLG